MLLPHLSAPLPSSLFLPRPFSQFPTKEKLGKASVEAAKRRAVKGAAPKSDYFFCQRRRRRRKQRHQSCRSERGGGGGSRRRGLSHDCLIDKTDLFRRPTVVKKRRSGVGFPCNRTKEQIELQRDKERTWFFPFLLLFVRHGCPKVSTRKRERNVRTICIRKIAASNCAIESCAFLINSPAPILDRQRPRFPIRVRFGWPPRTRTKEEAAAPCCTTISLIPPQITEAVR